MKDLGRFFPLMLMVCISSCSISQKPNSSEIKWDTWGVPHIKGTTQKEVFYGFGWAQMKAHGNLILKGFGKARGRSAEYWEGDQNTANDRLIRQLDIPKRALQWYNLQDEETKRSLSAFVDGMNAYANAHPESIDNELKVVLPIKVTDPLAKLQVSYHLMVGAFALQPQAAGWKNSGSNAWAIAPSKSQSGHSLLLIQPHPPWFDDYLFFEAHLQSDTFNAYGITLLGSPSIAMGFNEHLGWGLTFNQADAMDLVELQIKDNQYRVNGKWKPLQLETDTLKIRQKDQVISQPVQIKQSDFGYIIEEKGNKALALRLSGFDRPFFTKQFIRMATSKNLKEFENALKMQQLPLQNIVYADRHGDIFYLYNGIIPKRPSGNLNDWSQIVPSTKPGALVKDYVLYEDLPKIKNPTSGFVANSNNGPWSSTYPFIKKPDGYPDYIAPEPFQNFDLRSKRSIKMLLSNTTLRFDDVVRMQSSTYSELADQTVDELVAFAKKSEDSHMQKAAKVLSDWDRKLDTNSKGAVLFYTWYNHSKSSKLFIEELNEKDPLHTPKQLTEEAKGKLFSAVQETKERYGSLDVQWGDVFKIHYADQSFDGGLGLNELGSFNAGFYRPMSATAFTLLGGSAYTGVVEFGKTIKAKGILGYGNASQKDSPFRGDQIQMLIDRKLRDIWFYEEGIDENLFLKEVLQF